MWQLLRVPWSRAGHWTPFPSIVWCPCKGPLISEGHGVWTWSWPSSASHRVHESLRAPRNPATQSQGSLAPVQRHLEFLRTVTLVWDRAFVSKQVQTL